MNFMLYEIRLHLMEYIVLSSKAIIRFLKVLYTTSVSIDYCKGSRKQIYLTWTWHETRANEKFCSKSYRKSRLQFYFTYFIDANYTHKKIHDSIKICYLLIYISHDKTILQNG